MDRLKSLFQTYFSCQPHTVTPITGSGSGRTYVRLTGAHGSAIGVIGTDRKENDTFIYIDHVLNRSGIDVPQIFDVSSDGMAYLQEDLGDTSLFSLLHTPVADRYVKQVMCKLPALQFAPLEANKMYPVQQMTSRHVMWDLNYFKYCFLKPAAAGFDEEKLENDFNRLTQDICTGQIAGFIYRDCQSRNIMIKDESIRWIDFQSMRIGPVLYDIASFLWQARAGFTAEERSKYAELYFENLRAYTNVPIADMRDMLPVMVLFRTLQVLGAYGLRGLTEHKAHFIESIPGALANLQSLIEDGVLSLYPELERVAVALTDSTRFAAHVPTNMLNVSVFSFSYKKGYPEDLSGNGGGFMFDCRALHNPGRYDEYKSLTGRDRSVIDFLEERQEVQPFLAAASMLTHPAVDKYIKRGFSSLQIGFGCTGGRHRSVYCAEHMAHNIAKKFGDRVKVTLIHREQGITEQL